MRKLLLTVFALSLAMFASYNRSEALDYGCIPYGGIHDALSCQEYCQCEFNACLFESTTYDGDRSCQWFRFTCNRDCDQHFGAPAV